MSLFEITYVSKASQLMGMLSLTQILDSALKWNNSHHLTGVLFYDNGHFCQLLEGQHKDILEVWERIECDNRHISLRQLAISPIEDIQIGCCDFMGLNKLPSIFRRWHKY